MSGTQRYSWVITVVDTDQRRIFNPGDTVIIGRTPLRPASVKDTGALRLNIKDPKKSMSKKHLSLSLDAKGEATIRDLSSTNGTYVVKPNGELARIPADRSLVLDESPVRLQLGDVGLVLEEIPEGASVDKLAPVQHRGKHAVDLFADAKTRGQAPDGQLRHFEGQQRDEQEALSVGMDVHDVLDLRAGEPTGAFDAATVRRRIRAMQQQERAMLPASFQPGTGLARRDRRNSSSDAVLPKRSAEAVGKPSSTAVDEPPLPGSGTMAAPQPQPEMTEQEVEEAVAQQHSHKSEVAPLIDEHARRATTGTAVQGTVAQQVAAASEARMTRRMMQQHSNAVSVASPSEATRETASEAEQASETRKMRPVSAWKRSTPSEQPVGSTGYEPGSVFDRLTRGEYEASRPAVVVDGALSSDDAQQVTDHAKQFEMAKHHELLPFLALNPYLYDDLYSWLEAIGDPAITTALKTNSGYQAYQENRR